MPDGRAKCINKSIMIFCTGFFYIIIYNRPNNNPVIINYPVSLEFVELHDASRNRKIPKKSCDHGFEKAVVVQTSLLNMRQMPG